MVEARIECLADHFYLPGLGIRDPMMKKGQVEWVSAEKAQKSSIVDHARRVGAIAVRYRTRAEAHRSQNVPVVGQPRVPKLPPPPLPPVEVEPPVPVVDEALLAQVAQQAAQAAVNAQATHLKMMVAGEVARAVEGLNVPAVDAEALQQSLVGAVEAAVSNMKTGIVQTPAGPMVTLKEEDEAPWVPDQIMGSDAKVKLDTREESTTGGNVSSAREKLREARRKAKTSSSS